MNACDHASTALAPTPARDTIWWCLQCGGETARKPPGQPFDLPPRPPPKRAVTGEPLVDAPTDCLCCGAPYVAGLVAGRYAPGCACNAR